MVKVKHFLHFFQIFVVELVSISVSTSRYPIYPPLIV